MKRVFVSFLLPAALWLTGLNRVAAQCANPVIDTLTYTTTPALCFGSGDITVNTVNGSPAPSDGSVMYQLVDASTGAVIKPAQTSPDFTLVGAGNYKVQMQTICSTSAVSGFTTYSKANATATVSGILTGPSGATGTLLQNSVCSPNSGSLQVNVGTLSIGGGGSLSKYTYQLTQTLPSAGAAPTTIGTPQSSNVFNNLPAGTYYPVVYDSCGDYSVGTTPVTVSNVADGAVLGVNMNSFWGSNNGTPTGNSYLNLGLSVRYLPDVGIPSAPVQTSEQLIYNYTLGNGATSGNFLANNFQGGTYVNGVITTPTIQIQSTATTYPITLHLQYKSPCGNIYTLDTVIQDPKNNANVNPVITSGGGGCDSVTYNISASSSGGVPFTNTTGYSINGGTTWNTLFSSNGVYTVRLKNGQSYNIGIAAGVDTIFAQITAAGSFIAKSWQYVSFLNCDSVPAIDLGFIGYTGTAGSIKAVVLEQPAGAAIPSSFTLGANGNGGTFNGSTITNGIGSVTTTTTTTSSSGVSTSVSFTYAAYTIYPTQNNLVPGRYIFQLTDSCGNVANDTVYLNKYTLRGRALPYTSPSCPATQAGIQFVMDEPLSYTGSPLLSGGSETYSIREITNGANTLIDSVTSGLTQTPGGFVLNAYTLSNVSPGLHTYAITLNSSYVGNFTGVYAAYIQAQNCIIHDTVNVNVPAPSGSLGVGSVLTATNCSDGTGTIALTASGGGGGYTYVLQQTTNGGVTWNGIASDTTGIFNELATNGVYRVAVTDICSNGIFYNTTISGSPVPLTFNVPTQPCNGDTLIMTLPYVGGATYSWTINGVTSSNVSNLMVVKVPAEGSGIVNTYQGFITLPGSSCTIEGQPFTLNPDSCGKALPITLQEFTVQAKGSTALLQWTTATEINNKGFGIQRSADASNWQAIAFVNSKAQNGNSSQQLNYSYTDNSPANGINYYRLKQTDLNGNSVYSSIQSATFHNLNAVATISVVPNPARNTATITGLKGGETVQVFSAGGSNVFEESNVPAGKLLLHVSHWVAGVYFIHVADKNGAVQQAKLIVK